MNIKRPATWLNPTVITLVCISGLTLVASWQPVTTALEYHHGWLSDAEYWRPLTAWIAQLNVNHWLVNQWGLVLMALLLPQSLARADVLALVWVWLACSLALANSDYGHYVGLSGLLYGWLVWALWRTPYYPAWIRWGISAVLSAKVVLENLSSVGESETSMLADFIQAEIAVESHAWGLAAGWLAILLAGSWALYRRFQRD